MNIEKLHQTALLLIDIQNDLLNGGSLAVPKGNDIIPIVNQIMPQFEHIYATQDWHPANHGSFASNHHKKVGEVIDLHGLPQILWPDHCIQYSEGAQLAPTLNQDNIKHIFQKGTDINIDSYSGFFDNGHRKATGMGDYLKEKGIQNLFLCGLATDYCVKFTALDAIELGFNTFLITDATQGVNLKPNDVYIATQEMKTANVHLIDSNQIQMLL